MLFNPGLESAQFTLTVILGLSAIGIEEDEGRESLNANALGSSVGGSVHLGNDYIIVSLEGSTQLVIDGGKLLAMSALRN